MGFFCSDFQSVFSKAALLSFFSFLFSEFKLNYFIIICWLHTLPQHLLVTGLALFLLRQPRMILLLCSRLNPHLVHTVVCVCANFNWCWISASVSNLPWILPVNELRAVISNGENEWKHWVPLFSAYTCVCIRRQRPATQLPIWHRFCFEGSPAPECATERLSLVCCGFPLISAETDSLTTVWRHAVIQF